MPIIGTASNSKRSRNLGTTRHRSEPIVHIELSGAAIQKILDFLSSQTPISHGTAETDIHHLRPTLRPWISIIDQILKEDARVPKRYRTTAMRILKTLRQEHGFTGGYTVVQEYVQQARAAAGEAPSRRSRNIREESPKAQTNVQESRVDPGDFGKLAWPTSAVCSGPPYIRT